MLTNLNEDDFKYLSQEFDKNQLDLVKERGFYHYEYMTDLDEFKEELPSKEKFYSSLSNRKINEKEYDQIFNVWNKFEMKTMKDFTTCT